MDKKTLLVHMERLDACSEATEYVTNHESDDAQVIWETCERGDWMCWLIAECNAQFPDWFGFGVADRAVRVYAVNALQSVGLTKHAATLRNLAPIVDVATARAARDASYASDAAGYAASDAAGYAATCGARAASYAASSAAWVAAIAASYAARDAELKLQSESLRHMQISTIIEP